MQKILTLTNLDSHNPLATPFFKFSLTKNRIRKEITNIEELAESIWKHGLLNPIAVMRDAKGGFRLLAGFRRLEAAKFLAWDEISVNIATSAVERCECQGIGVDAGTNLEDVDNPT